MKRILAAVLAAAVLVGSGAAQGPVALRGQPSGMLAAEDGLLVADTWNKVIWLVKDGGAEPWAGQSGVAGLNGEPVAAYLDGTRLTAFFAEPWDIVPFRDGYLVSDASNHVVRYVDREGVRTAAGSGEEGLKNAVGVSARFSRPTGLAPDGAGGVYIADTGNDLVRHMDAAGTVTTYAKGFSGPTGLSWADGVLYVADTENHRICKVEDGTVSVVAGGEEGYADAPAASARFSGPQGVLPGPDGTLYVADTGNGAVRRIAGGWVDTLVRPAGEDQVYPVAPRGLLLEGDTLYVSDQFAGLVFPVSLAGADYADVGADAWYAHAAEGLYDAGIMTGVAPGRFGPEEPLSRASCVVLLQRMYRNAHPTELLTGRTAFPDVAEDAWYAAPAAWAADAGLVSGSEGRFHPDRALTRQELAAFLYRYDMLAGSAPEAEPARLEAFSDGDQVGPWAREAVAWACGAGVLEGSGGLLRPADPLTRAEAAVMLWRYLDFAQPS